MTPVPISIREVRAGSREERERRGLLLGKVMNPEARSVDADFLRGHGQLNRLQERVPGGTHARPGTSRQ